MSETAFSPTRTTVAASPLESTRPASTRHALTANPVSTTNAGVKVSMDGRGHWTDNVFIERLWRSVKYECVYLPAYETGSKARAGIGKWVEHSNLRRPHASLGGRPRRRFVTTSEGWNWRRDDTHGQA